MPQARLHLVNLYLAEGNVKQRKEKHRHDMHHFRTHHIAYGLKKGDIGKQQINYSSEHEGAGQRKLAQEHHELTHIYISVVFSHAKVRLSCFMHKKNGIKGVLTPP